MYSQNSIRVTYKSFFSKSELSDELRKYNPEQYFIKKDEEMMAELLSFNLDISNNKSLFYMKESLISDYEDKGTRDFVIGYFYGLDKIYIDKTLDTICEQKTYKFGNILKNTNTQYMTWEITNEKKFISGYECIKAKFTYIQKWRGKRFPWHVEAWFAPDLPYSFGPIRYQGLPGLILELSEENRGFIVEKIEFLDSKIEIKMPTEGVLYDDEIVDKKVKKVQEILIND